MFAERLPRIQCKVHIRMGQIDDAGNGETGNDRSGKTVPDNRPESSQPTVDAHESDEGNTVFTEPGNSHAWIATDTTVDIQR